MQGYWIQWCNFVKNDYSWKTLLAMPPALLSFSLEATYNTLPCPSNLKRWRLTTESSCFLCNKSVCTSAHILGACNVALSQGRFTFRHDSILRELVLAFKDFLFQYKPNNTSHHGFINFVKQGSKPSKSSKKVHSGILNSASDWKLCFDLGDKLVIPAFLTISTLRPDILLFSILTKKVVIIELTSPCEENMAEWHKVKTEKYHTLCSSIRSNGWSVFFFAIEVGARGFCSESVRSCLFQLGFNNKLCKKSLKSLSSIALKCSFEIWLCRNSKSWTHDLPTIPSTSDTSPPVDRDLTNNAPRKTSNSSFSAPANGSKSRSPTKSSSSAPSSKGSSSLSSAVLSTGCFSPGIKEKQK